ncbi:MAG: hypothetical protein OXE57_12990 [Alphaproteobacteria bacterium]|nr:hypothetical protein [Alphaproteobacteria bacterium]
MADRGMTQGSRSSAAVVTEDQLAAVDEMFDLMLKNVVPDGAVIEADREGMLGSVVGVFDERVKAMERSVDASGGSGSAPTAMVGQLNCYVELRGKARERFRKETGKEWTPPED